MNRNPLFPVLTFVLAVLLLAYVVHTVSQAKECASLNGSYDARTLTCFAPGAVITL